MLSLSVSLQNSRLVKKATVADIVATFSVHESATKLFRNSESSRQPYTDILKIQNRKILAPYISNLVSFGAAVKALPALPFRKYKLKISEMSEEVAPKLTAADRARIARNREKALQIRATKTGRLTAQHPYAKETVDGEKVIKIQGNKFVDGGGGFLIEKPLLQNDSDPSSVQLLASNVQDEALQIPVVYHECLECCKDFAESYLMKNFNYLVCDGCRDSEEKHSLITRTEAKTEYLLKDCDLDKREPILKFICRKNPHNVRWGDMKLYLHLQIEQRALDVWGSEEQLVKEREERDEKRDKSKLKKYNKNLKQLRMEVRSSLFDRTSAGPHKHVYGEETYDEDNDEYTHACTECGFSETYEKM